MGPEVPDNAHIALVQAQVHAAGRDEIEIAELPAGEDLLHRSHRRAVEERLARHEHDVGGRGRVQQRLHLLARRRKRLLDESVLPGGQALRRQVEVRVDGRRQDDRVEGVVLHQVVETDGGLGPWIPPRVLGQPRRVEIADPRNARGLHVHEHA